MNEKQQTAYGHPCYLTEDLDNPIFSERMKFGTFSLIVKVRVMAFLGNELWRATALLLNEAGKTLRESDLDFNQRNKVAEILDGLLNGVGTGETYPYDLESDFEIIRLLTEKEKEELPKPNLHKLLEVEKRQKFVLANPYPSIDLMLAKRFSSILDLGGAVFNTVLTIQKDLNESRWHASVSVQGENKIPMKLFGEMSFEQGQMCMTMAKILLEGIGVGRLETGKPAKDARIFHLYRRVSENEKKMLPQLGAFDFVLNSPFAVNRNWN